MEKLTNHGGSSIHSHVDITHVLGDYDLCHKGGYVTALSFCQSTPGLKRTSDRLVGVVWTIALSSGSFPTLAHFLYPWFLPRVDYVRDYRRGEAQLVGTVGDDDFPYLIPFAVAAYRRP